MPRGWGGRVWNRASTFGCCWWAISKAWVRSEESRGGRLTRWRLREFLGLKLSESPPDHSTLSRTRRLIDVQTHAAVFDWVLQRVGEAGLLKGKTLGIDATTLEAKCRAAQHRSTG